MEASAELDEVLAALLLPLEELEELELDELLVLDDSALQVAVSPHEQPLDSSVIQVDNASSSTLHQESVAATSMTKSKSKSKKKIRPVAYNSNSARNRRRHELVYLRERVEELQKELRRTGVLVSTTDRVSASQSVWKEIATRQFSERQRAETENQRLREALETQIQVAKSLEAILTKRSTPKVMEDCGLGRYMRVVDRGVDRSDAGLFDELLANISDIHADAEWLVRQGGGQADSTLTPSHDARMRPTEHGLLVEMYATDLLPFSLGESSAAAWQYFSHGKNHLPDPIRHYYERITEDARANEDVVLERSGFEMAAKGSKIAVKLTQALRRYAEQDRVVIAWSAMMEPVEFDSKPMSGGFSLRQWGCMVLRMTSPTDGTSALTVLQSGYFMAPEFHGDVDSENHSEHEVEAGKLTECVLTWAAAGQVAWRQRIENILLDSHLRLERTSISPQRATASCPKTTG